MSSPSETITLPSAEQYRSDRMRELEVLAAQRRQFERALETLDDDMRSLIEITTRLDFDTLPTADSPPLIVSIMRAELDLSIAHLRRGGTIARRLGLDVKDFERALALVRAAVASFPADLPIGEKQHVSPKARA
jgi:hypothetical protein